MHALVFHWSSNYTTTTQPCPSELDGNQCLIKPVALYLFVKPKG